MSNPTETLPSSPSPSLPTMSTVSTVPLGAERFFAGDPASLLFAHFLDKQCLLRSLHSEVRELSELVLGGAEVVKYSEEVSLLSSLLYYLPCLLSLQGTLGQQYCGLSLYQHVTVTGGVERITQSATKKTLLTTYLPTALLYAGLPYLYARRGLLWRNVYETWDILTSTESVEGISAGGTAESAEESVSSSERQSVLQLVVKAIGRSISSIAQEVDVRLERICSFASELHLWLFLLNNK